MHDYAFIRTLRTPHSERYLIRTPDTDTAALDIHFRPRGGADATLVIFEQAQLPEEAIPGLLTAIDEVVLPDMTLAGKDISFTVVIGRVLGAYTPDGEA
ncbi:MAG: hypothetical protein RL689_1488 [Planctomycetota bacterium]|jgi:hypothetical protein